jgi:hypothetical protein
MIVFDQILQLFFFGSFAVGVIKIVLFPEFWNEQEIIAFSCEIQ